MRRLMLFTIGFVIGCAIGIWALCGSWMLLAAAIFAGTFALLVAIRPNLTRTIISIILLGTAIGLCWQFCFDHFYVDTVRELNGKTKTVSIEVTDFITKSDYGYTGTGKILYNGKSYNVQYTINDALKIYPGDTITGRFSFRFTGYQGEESSTHHQGKGILLLAYATETVKHKALDKIPVKYFAACLRRTIIRHLDNIFPEDQVGFARALLLGDARELDYADDVALKISGIRHIIAVSGLHVSILLSFAYIFSRGNRFLHAGIGIPLLVLFAAIAGFTPSIVRACVMQGVMIMGILFDKEYDAPTSLSLAVLLIIGVNPLAITSVSFQLSVGCVIGIMLFSRKIHDVLMRTKLGPAKGKSFRSKLIRGFVNSVSITLSTMIITLPISAYYFGMISIISVVSNFLTLWLVSICFYGVVFSCLISFLIPAAASVIAWLVSWPMRMILTVARLLSKIPFASVSVYNPYFLSWVIFCYLLFAVFLLCKKKPSILFAALALIGFAVSTLLAYMEPRIDNYRMTVLDVGQGQCIILQSKEACYIVDCGGDYASGTADLAAQTLRSCGVQKIDGLILTHFDFDHAGGAEYLLAQMQIDHIYAPDEESAEYDFTYRKIRKEMTLNCGDGTITIFPGEKGKSGNESCLCILFQVGECDILITGDRNNKGEQHLIEHYQIPQLDILVAGHHGADSSTSLYLLQHTQPASVIISVGEDNSYGHPNEAVLRRLIRMNSVIWRTDRDGTIIIRG